MAIPKSIRDKLLVEAQHRCTICAEKCFEIHHVVEIADGGTDDEDNLIVLCPNCHQHRYHRSGEFTRDQLRLYKAKLLEKKEIDHRLLLTLEEIKSEVGKKSAFELTQQLHDELSKAAKLIDPKHSPQIHESVVETAKTLANRNVLPVAARKAIEIEFEVKRQNERAKFAMIEIIRIDDDAYRKSNEFGDAYFFELVLNQKPSSEWKKIFNHVHETSFYTMKRETSIAHDRIQMIIADTDNLQDHVNFAKRLVDETNSLVQSRIYPEIDRRTNAAKNQALKEYDTIQKLKSHTENLHL